MHAQQQTLTKKGLENGRWPQRVLERHPAKNTSSGTASHERVVHERVLNTQRQKEIFETITKSCLGEKGQKQDGKTVHR